MLVAPRLTPDNRLLAAILPTTMMAQRVLGGPVQERNDAQKKMVKLKEGMMMTA